MELQKKIDAVQEMRLLEDVFFEAVAQDIPAVQEILRTILEDENLVVESVITQRTIMAAVSVWMPCVQWEMNRNVILRFSGQTMMIIFEELDSMLLVLPSEKAIPEISLEMLLMYT